MFKFLKKTSVLALISAIFISFSPLALAQSDLASSLDDIKEKLEEPTSCSTDATCGTGNRCENEICVDEDGNPLKVKIIDYSENKWGRLPKRVIDILRLSGDNNFSEGIEGIYEYLEVLEPGAHANQEKMEKAFASLEGELIDMSGLTNDDVELIINEIGAYQFHGERQLRDTVRAVAVVMRNLIGGLAIIWIVLAGIRLVMAGGDESVITEQKRAITYALIGLVSILLIERLIDVLYGPAGTFRMELDETTTGAFSVEVFAFINFLKAIVGTIAIIMIVVSGLRTIFAFGEEEQITKQRKAILWVAIGLILMLIDRIIVEQIFILPVQHEDVIQSSNVTTIINTFGQVMQFVLGFVGLIALAALIYGAGNMIANYGNDELVQKSKKIIKNAIIGLIVIISAYTIIATLVVFK